MNMANTSRLVLGAALVGATMALSACGDEPAPMTTTTEHSSSTTITSPPPMAMPPTSTTTTTTHSTSQTP